MSNEREARWEIFLLLKANALSIRKSCKSIEGDIYIKQYKIGILLQVIDYSVKTVDALLSALKVNCIINGVNTKLFYDFLLFFLSILLLLDYWKRADYCQPIDLICF